MEETRDSMFDFGINTTPHSELSPSKSTILYEGGSGQDSDVDNIDFQNFKGIYIDEDPNRKFQDPETGCHFEYYDLCKRMAKLKTLRKKLDE